MEETFLPWGIPTEEFWEQPSTAPAVSGGDLPDDYRRQVEMINDAVGRGRISEAALTAQQLDAQSTAVFGPAHPYTVTLRELRGDLAHLDGDAATATAWYLHAAGIRAAHQGVQHPLTRQSIDRASELWMGLADTDAQRMYGDLVGLLNGIAGPDAPSTQAVVQRAHTFSAPTRPLRLGNAG